MKQFINFIKLFSTAPAFIIFSTAAANAETIVCQLPEHNWFINWANIRFVKLDTLQMIANFSNGDVWRDDMNITEINMRGGRHLLIKGEEGRRWNFYFFESGRARLKLTPQNYSLDEEIMCRK
jgi:hypothetical protein